MFIDDIPNILVIVLDVITIETEPVKDIETLLFMI